MGDRTLAHTKEKSKEGGVMISILLHFTFHDLLCLGTFICVFLFFLLFSSRLFTLFLIFYSYLFLVLRVRKLILSILSPFLPFLRSSQILSYCVFTRALCIVETQGEERNFVIRRVVCILSEAAPPCSISTSSSCFSVCLPIFSSPFLCILP